MKTIASAKQIGFKLFSEKRYLDALNIFHWILEKDPDNLAAANNAGVCMIRLGEFVAAEQIFQKVIALAPKSDEGYRNISTCYLNLGRVPEAVRACSEALKRNLDPIVFSNLCYYLQYLEGITPAILFDAASQFGRQYGARKPKDRKALWKPAPGPIQVGIISPDLRKHSVAYFLEPLLRAIDPKRYRITLFIDGPEKLDAITTRFQELAEWCDVRGRSDREVQRVFKRLGITIAIDLSGHTGYNRLPMFGQRFAPVQMSWLGYLGTTGLNTMDYRIVDEWTALPPEYSTETQLILPTGLHCYAPQTNNPIKERLPGPVRFCNFGNLAKISKSSRRLWAQVLARVPNSELHIMANGFQSESVRAHWQKLFAEDVIPEERLWLKPPIKDHLEYLEHLGEMDIWLDTQPYSSATTACEALWMGVPVVTMRGQTPTGRLGECIVKGAGLSDMVCEDEMDFIRTATFWAMNGERREFFRTWDREAMKESALCRQSGFTWNVMGLFDGMVERLK